jgi:hypothetical protein
MDLYKLCCPSSPASLPIMDLLCGSHTSLIAAVHLGIPYIALDDDPSRFSIICKKNCASLITLIQRNCNSDLIKKFVRIVKTWIEDLQARVAEASKQEEELESSGSSISKKSKKKSKKKEEVIESSQSSSSEEEGFVKTSESEKEVSEEIPKEVTSQNPSKSVSKRKLEDLSDKGKNRKQSKHK